MRVLLILFRKELKSYFLTPFGWIVLAFAAVMQATSLSTALKAFQDTAIAESLVHATFQTNFFWFYFLFLFPLLTMRLFSEETRSGTIETLLTAPIRTWQVVLSKYLAALLAYLITWIPAFIHFLLFTTLTDVPPPFVIGELQGAALILFLMGSYFIALGCLASAFTQSQITAGLIAIAILAFHYFLGLVTYIWGEQMAAAPLFHYISSQEHLALFTRGVIDSRPIIYYLSAAFLTLILTHQVLDYRRWKP